jgi:hypothetical protein
MGPLDFWLFGDLKRPLIGLHDSELQQLLEDVSADQVQDIFRAWIERIRCDMEHSGNYDTS